MNSEVARIRLANAIFEGKSENQKDLLPFQVPSFMRDSEYERRVLEAGTVLLVKSALIQKLSALQSLIQHRYQDAGFLRDEDEFNGEFQTSSVPQYSLTGTQGGEVSAVFAWGGHRRPSEPDSIFCNAIIVTSRPITQAVLVSDGGDTAYQFSKEVWRHTDGQKYLDKAIAQCYQTASSLRVGPVSSL